MAGSEPLVQLPCVCASMRRATRAATRMYDRELREDGLRSTQFTLLQALHLAGTITQGNLVKSERGDDRRERHLRLSVSGERKFQDALPAWRRAQNQLTKTIGRDWNRLERDLRLIAASVA